MDKQTRDIEDLMDKIKKMHESEDWSKTKDGANPGLPEVKSEKEEKPPEKKEAPKVEEPEKKGGPHFDSNRIKAEKETFMIKLYRDIETVEKTVLEKQENICVALEKLEGVINKMMERETEIAMINAEADELEKNLNKEMADLKSAKSELQKILGK